jgi:hypothetical protein
MNMDWKLHLKEVVISVNPRSNFLQIVWTKNKTNNENGTTVSITT